MAFALLGIVMAPETVDPPATPARSVTGRPPGPGGPCAGAPAPGKTMSASLGALWPAFRDGPTGRPRRVFGVVVGVAPRRDTMSRAKTRSTRAAPPAPRRTGCRVAAE